MNGRPTRLRLPQHPLHWAIAVFVLLSSVYWCFIASDRYVSEARVVLARSDLASGQAMDFATLLGGAAGMNRPDQLLLRDHLRSIDMLRKLDARLQLRAHYSGHGDWLSRLWRADAPIEHFERHMQQRVSIELDEFAGVLVVRAQAYSPDVAQAITALLLSEGERHMNALGHEMAQEQVRFLERQVDELARRVQTTRAAVLAFQNREGMVSPQATAENIAAIVARLEAQLAELQTRRSGLLAFLQPQAALLQEVNAQITAVEQQLQKERARLTTPRGGTLNATVEEFQRLSEVGPFHHINKIAYNRVLHGDNTSIKHIKTQKDNHFLVVNNALKRQQATNYRYTPAVADDDTCRKYTFVRADEPS